MASNPVMLCVIGVVMVMVTIDNTDACSCMFAHPQTQYCGSDFVMLVTPRGSGEVVYKKVERTDWNHQEQKNVTRIHRYPIDKAFNVRVRKVFHLKTEKSSSLTNKTMRVAVLHTATEESLCGLDLEPRVKYLVTGNVYNGRLQISLCDWVTRWILLTKSQKRNLRYTYKNNCDCKIKTPYSSMLGFDTPDTDMDKVCQLNMRRDGDCYVRQSACVHSKNSPLGICKWHNHSRLKKCKADKRNGKRLP